MKTYSADLVCALFDAFPDSFSVIKRVACVEYIPGRYGVETIETGSADEVLAECILSTASAISLKYGPERAARYISSFKPARVQRDEIAQFMRA